MIGKLFPALFLTGVFVAAAQAQSNPEQAILNARDEFTNIKNRSIELERVKRDAAKRPVTSDATLKFPEIKEDFEEVQKINGDIVKLSRKTPINNAVIFKLVAEINHRAARLKSNLFPAAAKSKNNKQQTAVESPNVKTLLNDLDKSIDSFVHSSIFQNLNLVVTADSLKAQKDLENVIKISGAIKAKTKN